MESNNARGAIAVDRALSLALRHSAYLRRLIEARPELAATPLDARCDASTMRDTLARETIVDDASLKRALRRLRQQVMLRVIARDLAGAANLAEVMQTVTALAEIAIEAAVRQVTSDLVHEYGAPRGQASDTLQHLHVVGMGKLGGGELNVSSDIDLILIYPEDGNTDGPRSIANHEYFTRLARRFIGALSEITEHGYVFRVDTRLRPYGDSGPLVSSFEMLENYLVTQGREWERYAWIKGRPLTGDRGAELTELVRPFVFRRHLDFSAFASMRELHQQVRREVERRDIADNIKLGPGGIREIEFIVQVFQLIRGGPDAALRAQPTLQVLPLLAEKRLLPEGAVAELQAAYVFLRNLEHRLQYLDDQQTHRLPDRENERELIATSMGFDTYPAFVRELDRHRTNVTRQFEQIFAATPNGQHALAGVWLDAGEDATAEHSQRRLAELGFRRPADLQQRLMAIRRSARFREMPAPSQARLDRLVPLAIEAAAAYPNPDETLERLLQLLDSVSRRESYLALLEEYPQALQRVAELMSASPWVAQYLTQHPILLDELLDTRTLYGAPDWPVLTPRLRAELDAASGDTEKQMDLLRHFKQVQTVRLVAQDVAGSLPVETLSDHLSDLAFELLRQVLRLAWLSLRQRHRDEPSFAIVAYGKLGGKELGYASDLDLVFLYDDAAADAALIYARLAQRVNHWLTSMTAAGILYETDLRLRPDGVSGLLVSPLESFRDYQLTHAWVWEHQALSRARFVAGDAVIGRRFEELRIDVLRQARELGKLKSEIVAMRRKMFDGHPNPSALFDLKHDPGGIIDVEFIVQYIVLGHAHEHAELTGNIGNLALLKLAASLALVPEREALRAHAAYRRFRQLQHSLRLQGERYARVPPQDVRDHVQAVRALWHLVFGDAEIAPAQPPEQR
ncbi:MAG TPA: bifunctional [glutamate--ammonia ligase]-adenylyl-L-tyrosine phosphorylase/[glutamate--ammonia-ligase] adenylyltransferase [Burkholderiales bacterium]|nr:bifunctional [glutamate--ammonia ligase]-adenylyl-L-tyrosine phosphorylase/[glutamate--ammonia-ligase] adenylyltransferase [Burkholderiales bacterium]